MIKFFPAFVLVLLLSVASHAEEVQYLSGAKLLVGGAEVNPKLENGEPIPDLFFATNVELLQSERVQRAAKARVISMHPDVQIQPCKVEARRLPGTHIIAILATGPEPTYVCCYLDAVMDEFIAVRRELRALGGAVELAAATDELVKVEKEMPLAEQRIKAAELGGAKPEQLIEPKARLQQMKMAYDRHLGTVRKLEDKLQKSGEVFAIIERATKPVLLKPDR